MNEIDVPNALKQEEISRMREQLAQQMPPGSDTEHLTDELFTEEADRRVRLGLVIGEIVRQKEIRAEAADIRQEVESIAATYQEPQHRQEVESIAATYQEPQQVIDYYYGNPELLQNIEGLVLEKAVTDSVLAEATVSEEPSTFKEIMNPEPPAAAEVESGESKS